MIWYLSLAGVALLLVGFLVGTAVRPKDVRREVRRLEQDLSRARDARARIRGSLSRAIDVNMWLRKSYLDELDAIRERVDDTLVSLQMWRDMVDRDEYDVTDLKTDLDSLARQLRIDSTTQNAAAGAVDGGDRS